MSAKDCITGKGEAGIVDKKAAKEVADMLDEQIAELKRAGVSNAEGVAEQRVLDAVTFKKLVQKRALVAQIKAQEGIRGRIVGKRNDAAGAAMSMLDFDPTNKFVGPNVVQMGHDIENQAFARMESLFERFRARFANVDKLPSAARDARKATMRQVVRELFGEDSGSPEARNYAEGAATGMEYLRKLFNASGGTIPKLEKWGLPQSHNRRLMASISEAGMDGLSPAATRARKAEIWADYVTPQLDRSRMTDFDTGLPLTDGGLRKLLTDTYEEIVTGGLSDIKPGGGIGVNLTGRRAQSRFLMFKDADSWLDYQERFGDESPLDTIIHHVRAMSRDIAMLRVLGPNPDASVHFAEKLIANETGQAALEGKGAKAARTAGNLFGGAERFRRMFTLVSGKLDQPGNSAFAAIDESNRNILQSAILGGATLSALSDRAFTFATASLLGIPNGRVLVRFLKEINPRSAEDRALALRVGFGAENFMGAAISVNRYTGEFLNPSVTRTMADSVLRASGLVRLTTAGRQAFQMEFLGEMTRLRGNAFDDIPEALRQGFKGYGITRADWDEFRQVEPWSDPKSGAKFLRPHDLIGDPEQVQAGPLFERHFELANKFMSMINAERDFAVPSTSTRARADVLAGTKPGTGWGFVTRNMATLKSFSLTLAYMHLNRAINGRLPGMTRAKFAAQLVIGATMMGALGVQMKQIAAGKDPIAMDSPKFWLQAAGTGGGLGIFGDFLFSDVNRFGGTFGDTLLGPVFGQEIPKAEKLTVGALQSLMTDGEVKNYGRELTDFARLMTPGRSLWYTSLAFDRMIFDEAQMQVDPNYSESFSRREQKARSDYGQEFFSPPGSGFPPSRGPNLGAAAP